MKEEVINRAVGFFRMCDSYGGWNRHHNEFPLHIIQTLLYQHNCDHCSICRKKIDMAKIGGYWIVKSSSYQLCPDCAEE